ncbi:PG0541 family transporter-associated protein [Pontibacter sp. SGAir0037]|uniref:PG0541 family transporter-associated protein n=1 Tax=Pontibacter sp. SGAir0037 TaxID=2571030 RepID=UPI0010F85EF9|nr:PG0541 family transporter-associated protein [Pontibacter sp. SGAir0037]
MIVFNQALSEEIVSLLDEVAIRGFTKFNDLQGRGSLEGEPRMGTHTWPALNNAILSVAPDDKADKLISRLKEINAASEEQGLKAFSWRVEVAVE